MVKITHQKDYKSDTKTFCGKNINEVEIAKDCNSVTCKKCIKIENK